MPLTELGYEVFEKDGFKTARGVEPVVLKIRDTYETIFIK